MARVLVVGGMRSGKSRYAESLVAQAPGVIYVATGASGPDDEEWEARIAEHRSRRPANWVTVETLDVAAVLRDDGAPDTHVVVDCLNGWLAGTMAAVGCWEDAPGAAKLLADAADELVAALAATSRPVVAVTNEVGMALVPTTRPGRWFTDELGALNARVAAVVDDVWQVIVGIPTRLR